MNMISTGAFLPEMDASNKQETVAEKFARVWEKKNSKVARAGGVSLMALSLAACGSSSDEDESGIVTGGTTTVAQTLLLDSSVNELTGGAGNDTFLAAEDVDGNDTISIGDSIDGGAGTDTLKVVTGNAITALPLGLSLTSVENVEVLSSDALTMDVSSFTSVTSVATTAAATNITAAATQNVSATAAGAAITVNGGNNVTVTSTANDGPDNISVGATTAAAGTVTVTQTGNTGNGDTAGTIGVTGGTVINVSGLAGNAGATGVDTVGGAITVTGNASTTTVNVTQSATATGADATATAAAVVGFTAGQVDILDANSASLTAAGTITSVSIDSWTGDNGAAGTTADVNSGALTSLTLSGTGQDLTVTAGALTTAVVDTLNLNVDGLTQTTQSTGLVIDQDYTTINIDSSGTASTIATIDIQAATAVTISGDAALTITASDLSAVETVTITNSAGVSIDNINADTVYTGGAGDDAVTLANATEVAIDMGAGDDTVTYGGATSTTAGAVGTVTGGDDNDTIVMTSDQAEAADDDAAFNTAFTSFEVLKLSDALDAGETLDLDGLNGVASVVLAAGGDNASTSVIDNLSNNGSVEIQAASTGVVVQIGGAAFNATDALGVTLTNSSNALVAFGSVTAASTETINITTNDTGTGADAAATIDTATLVATGAKTVTVSGNNGLDLTNTGNTAITTFDASGVVGDSAATVDTAANLAVKFASANTTATATVNITGGAGEDELDGNAAKDVISGGDGADTINGSTGQDTLTGGAGADIFEFMSLQGTSSDSTVAAPDVITDYALSTVATAGDMLNIDIDTAGPVDESADIVGDTTGAGQAAGVNYEVADGILTLSGAGAAAVDTLSEWLTEAAAVASADGDMLAFEFGTDTYIFAQNGAQDMVIELDGVTGVAALVEGVAATVDNTILITDIA